MIDAVGLAWRSPDGRVVRAAQTRVVAGEIIAVESSAAGATLLRVLATLVRPTEGRLTIDGIDALQAPGDARRRLFYTGPDAPLPEGLTAGEYVGFLTAARGMAAGRDRHFLARFNLDPDRPVAAMGRVERQLTRLAGAAAAGDRIVLLDRPHHGLDDAACGLVAEWLRQAAEIGGAVVIAGAAGLAGLPLRTLACTEAVA